MTAAVLLLRPATDACRSGILDENGLLQARDALWRLLRNAWQPAFAPGTLAR